MTAKLHPFVSAFNISGPALYNAARPSYPPQAVSHIVSLPSPSSTALSVVELGAGTGIFTRLLLDQGVGRIKDILAVEPAEGMRRGFGNSMIKDRSQGVTLEVVDGQFDRIARGENEVDLVVAAQAFHWIGADPLAGESAITEIARVLKPGGYFVLIWNLEDRTAAPWVSQLRDVYEAYESGTPQYRLGFWKSIYQLPVYTDKFFPATYEKFSQVLPATEELVLDRVRSKSYITSLVTEEQQDVVDRAREVVRRGEGKVWLDEESGTFEYPYGTDVFIMQRK